MNPLNFLLYVAIAGIVGAVLINGIEARKIEAKTIMACYEAAKTNPNMRCNFK